MKRILNKLIIIVIILLVLILIIVAAIGCKVQEQVKYGVTPIRQIPHISTPYPVPMIPTIIPKSAKTSQKVESYVFVEKWGSKGLEDGQFKNSNANMIYSINIAVDKDGYIYITDPGNYRIQKFDSNGNFILKWNSATITKETSKYFKSIAVDADNNLYVTECPDSYPRKANPYYIQKFTSYGEFITKWSVKEEEIKKLTDILKGKWMGFYPSEAEDILVSKDKHVYTVYDYGHYIIYKYDSKGHAITISDVGFGSGDTAGRLICGITIDSNSNIFILFERTFPSIAKYPGDPNTYQPPAENFIIKFDSNGHQIKEYKEIYDDEKKKLVDSHYN